MKNVKKLGLLFLLVLLLVAQTIIYALISENAQNERAKKQYERVKKMGEKLQNYPLPKNAIELKRISSFPSEALVHKDILLNMPMRIANDSSGNIYVTDLDENRILKFDSLGNFILQIGRKGQGPGDFAYPNEIVITKDDILMVSEIANMRIQFLNKEGHYLKSFNLFKGYLSWVVNNKGLIFAIPAIGRRDRDPKIIEVLSEEGEVLSSFGNSLDIKYARGMYNQARIVKNKIGELFVAFTFVPIVRKYSQEGELLAEFEIDNILLKEFGKFNLSNQAFLAKRKKVPYRALIFSIRGSDDGFYILSNSRRVEILEFDRSGKQRAFYWYMPEADDYLAQDFLVQDNNTKTFYILQRSPEAKIDVFAEKR